MDLYCEFTNPTELMLNLAALNLIKSKRFFLFYFEGEYHIFFRNLWYEYLCWMATKYTLGCSQASWNFIEYIFKGWCIKKKLSLKRCLQEGGICAEIFYIEILRSSNRICIPFRFQYKIVLSPFLQLKVCKRSVQWILSYSTFYIFRASSIRGRLHLQP